MTEPPAVASPDAAVSPEPAELPSGERIATAATALEDARARRAYRVPSGVNNTLIINKAVTPGRVTAIIVSERLGF